MLWLSEVPVSVVQAFVDSIPRLTAEEQSAGATVAAMGRFTKPGPWVRSQQASWNRAMRNRTPAAKATPSALAALGIGYAVAGPKNDG